MSNMTWLDGNKFFINETVITHTKRAIFVSIMKFGAKMTISGRKFHF